METLRKQEQDLPRQRLRAAARSTRALRCI
jgi:hypothetical protein